MLDTTDPIGQRVRTLRVQHALTQKDLAERAGVARFAVIRIERGDPVRPLTVRKIARALGVTPTALTIGQ